MASNNITKYNTSLYNAAINGDWEKAKEIFDADPRTKFAALDQRGMTCLHVSIKVSRSIGFVQQFVETMVSGDELANLRTSCGSTPLHIAAEVGNTVAADILCRKMPRLPYIQDYNEDFPVHTAAKNERAAILWLLIGVTTEEEPYQNKGGLRLISDTIHAHFFGIASSLVEKHPYLATLHDPTIGSALSTIAGKESVISRNPASRFISCSFFDGCDGVIAYNEESHSYLQNKARLLVALLCKNMESMEFNEAIHIAHHAVICATKIGNHEIVEMIIEAFPNAIYSSYNESSPGSIFHVAVLNRCEEVFKLLYHMNGHKFVYSDVADNSGNNLLHMAAKLAPSHKLNRISGAALQMQREIQWYQLVEKLVARSSKIQINNEGKTPKMVFTEEHKNLEEEGAKWMKETSQNCTVVASLIATFMFSCAFTVPVGNDGNTGLPIFYRQRMFFVYALFLFLSLLASTYALINFLSILISRYSEQEFLHTLPKRLLIGLISLFLSIMFMMVTCTATVYLVSDRMKWVLITVGVCGSLLLSLFLRVLFRLIIDLINCTYGRQIFRIQIRRPLY